MTIRAVQESDRDSWRRMREVLWPTAPGEHTLEIAQYFENACGEPAQVFLAFNDVREAIGLTERSIRASAEDCVTDHVAYLEGWYVASQARRQGVGKALLRAAESRARSRGCVALASDTEVDNIQSAALPRAPGFLETGVICCFKK